MEVFGDRQGAGRLALRYLQRRAKLTASLVWWGGLICQGDMFFVLEEFVFLPAVYYDDTFVSDTQENKSCSLVE